VIKKKKMSTSGKPVGELSSSIRAFRGIHIDKKHPGNKKFFDQLQLKTNIAKDD
jgi:hypothetical protein